MDSGYEQNRKELSELSRKAEYLKYTLNSLLYWDKITHMPPGGIGYRSEIMGFLGEELYGLMTGKRFAYLMDYFHGNSKNDGITDAMVRKLSRNAMYVAKVPQAEYTDYIRLVANAEQVWETAKAENNFLMIQPYLERLLCHYRKFAEYWGYRDNPYEAWLGYFEEGFDCEQMNGLIQTLKPAVISLLSEIRAAQGVGGCTKTAISPTKSIFEGMPAVNESVQMKLTKKILDLTGFSFQNGRVDAGAHPTILACSPSDVRLVTTFHERDLRAGIFGAVYLGGKGLYEQGIDRGLLGTMLAEVSSFALAEAVGKLYENRVGRSSWFWDHFTPVLKDQAPEFKAFDSGALFRDANQINLTSVRLDADELTATLHIIIRCELEQALMDGTLAISELPGAWNAKYKEYLDIEPENSGAGVLQDIHWAAGYFGYFGSYLLANVMSAQLGHQVEQDSKGFEAADAQMRLSMYRSWLSEKIFRFGGTQSSIKLMEQACGEPLRTDYYINYLKDRFSRVYQLTK